MVSMAKALGLSYNVCRFACNATPVVREIAQQLAGDPAITHIAMVHCETTTGIVNPLDDIAALAKHYELTFIVDAMSSFGGMDIEVKELGIDFLVSSANKCIQGVPGFSFVLAKRNKLLECEGNARSLSLDLFDQWQHMDKDGKWRFTSPTHVVAAFSRALDELVAEGGVSARQARYRRNNQMLRECMQQMGFAAYISEEFQSPIITTFLFPEEGFDFADFYRYVKERGFVLYPGKLTDIDTFRIGNIGEIYEADIRELCGIIAGYRRGG